jgi:hypothetical protein
MYKIIRVEHRVDGLGLFQMYTPTGEYRQHTAHSIANHIINKHTSFPTPEEEGLHMTDKHYCAYLNIHKWLTKADIQLLRKANYCFYLVEATDIQVGEEQAIIHEDTIVSKVDVFDFLV